MVVGRVRKETAEFSPVKEIRDARVLINNHNHFMTITYILMQQEMNTEIAVWIHKYMLFCQKRREDDVGENEKSMTLFTDPDLCEMYLLLQEISPSSEIRKLLREMNDLFFRSHEKKYRLLSTYFVAEMKKLVKCLREQKYNLKMALDFSKMTPSDNSVFLDEEVFDEKRPLQMLHNLKTICMILLPVDKREDTISVAEKFFNDLYEANLVDKLIRQLQKVSLWTENTKRNFKLDEIERQMIVETLISLTRYFFLNDSVLHYVERQMTIIRKGVGLPVRLHYPEVVDEMTLEKIYEVLFAYRDIIWTIIAGARNVGEEALSNHEVIETRLSNGELPAVSKRWELIASATMRSLLYLSKDVESYLQKILEGEEQRRFWQDALLANDTTDLRRNISDIFRDVFMHIPFVKYPSRLHRHHTFASRLMMPMLERIGEEMNLWTARGAANFKRPQEEFLTLTQYACGGLYNLSWKEELEKWLSREVGMLLSPLKQKTIVLASHVSILNRLSNSIQRDTRFKPRIEIIEPFLQRYLFPTLFNADEFGQPIYEEREAIGSECAVDEMRDEMLHIIQETVITAGALDCLSLICRLHTSLHSKLRFPKEEISCFGNLRDRDKTVGLRNESNMCYMNTVMQQIFAIPGVAADLFQLGEIEKNVDAENANSELMREMQLTAALLLFSCRDHVEPSGMQTAFRFDAAEMLCVRDQNDAFEFFYALIDKCDSLLEKLEKPAVFKKHLGGVSGYEYFCKDCQHRHKGADEDFNAINLELHGDNLEECLEHYMDGALLEGDSAYMCQLCGEKRTTLRVGCFRKCPKTLFIQLKRFAFDYSGALPKINRKCEFPMELDVSKYTMDARRVADETIPTFFQQYELIDGEIPFEKPTSPNRVRYELVGVIVHAGQIGAGHYTTYVKERREELREQPWYDKWLYINDTTVTDFIPDPITVDHVWYGGVAAHANLGHLSNMRKDVLENNSNAYMLIYQLIDEEKNTGEEGEKREEVNKEQVPKEVEELKSLSNVGAKDPVEKLEQGTEDDSATAEKKRSDERKEFSGKRRGEEEQKESRRMSRGKVKAEGIDQEKRAVQKDMDWDIIDQGESKEPVKEAEVEKEKKKQKGAEKGCENIQEKKFDGSTLKNILDSAKGMESTEELGVQLTNGCHESGGTPEKSRDAEEIEKERNLERRDSLMEIVIAEPFFDEKPQAAGRTEDSPIWVDIAWSNGGLISGPFARLFMSMPQKLQRVVIEHNIQFYQERDLHSSEYAVFLLNIFKCAKIYLENMKDLHENAIASLEETARNQYTHLADMLLTYVTRSAWWQRCFKVSFMHVYPSQPQPTTDLGCLLHELIRLDVFYAQRFLDHFVPAGALTFEAGVFGRSELSCVSTAFWQAAADACCMCVGISAERVLQTRVLVDMCVQIIREDLTLLANQDLGLYQMVSKLTRESKTAARMFLESNIMELIDQLLFLPLESPRGGRQYMCTTARLADAGTWILFCTLCESAFDILPTTEVLLICPLFHQGNKFRLFLSAYVKMHDSLHSKRFVDLISRGITKTDEVFMDVFIQQFLQSLKPDRIRANEMLIELFALVAKRVTPRNCVYLSQQIWNGSELVAANHPSSNLVPGLISLIQDWVVSSSINALNLMELIRKHFRDTGLQDGLIEHADVLQAVTLQCAEAGVTLNRIEGFVLPPDVGRSEEIMESCDAEKFSATTSTSAASLPVAAISPLVQRLSPGHQGFSRRPLMSHRRSIPAMLFGTGMQYDPFASAKLQEMHSDDGIDEEIEDEDDLDSEEMEERQSAEMSSGEEEEAENTMKRKKFSEVEIDEEGHISKEEYEDEEGSSDLFGRHDEIEEDEEDEDEEDSETIAAERERLEMLRSKK